MSQCLFTGHPPPGKHNINWYTGFSINNYLQTALVGNYLVSLISRELMKSLASCVISSKLSSLNSHCAAVTKARVSASLSPWNGDSPLSLQTEEEDTLITMIFVCTPPGDSKGQFHSKRASFSTLGPQEMENIACGNCLLVRDLCPESFRWYWNYFSHIGYFKLILADCECECQWLFVSVFLPCNQFMTWCNLSPEGSWDRLLPPLQPCWGKIVRKWMDGLMDRCHSQDVTDDPDAPHVSGQTNRLIINHFRCHKLWCPVHYLKRCGVICKHIRCI